MNGYDIQRNEGGGAGLESFSADREGMVPGDGRDEGEVQRDDGELGRPRRMVGQKRSDGVYPQEPFHEDAHRRGRAVHDLGDAGVLPEGAGLHGLSFRLGRRQVAGSGPDADGGGRHGGAGGSGRDLVCRKLLAAELPEASFIEPGMKERWYGGKDEGNYHTMYIAEIEKVLVKA